MSVALQLADAAASGTARSVIGNPGCWCASCATVLVGLLDHNAVFADVAERDALVRDGTYGASCAVDGL